MRKQNGGHILSISSQSAVTTSTGLGFYAATKKSLEALHEGEAALLWKKWNIKMTLLECGSIITGTPHLVDKMMHGTRMVDDHDLYGDFIRYQVATYRANLPLIGLPVEEYARKILKIMETPEELHFRIQLGFTEASVLWKDPTGDKGLVEEEGLVGRVLKFLPQHEQ
eukprot:TRINITY_DN5519_c0_g1_i3.p1 TRINITY_DN5519_c0_g1~~TRINITY_DN5519_c0_g1_i3.p1  ORF type:complete len:168 (-),score=50.02 TRINITY_DN5519_c0_g1_i3:104-607(-)